jgi:hypothetical protein
VAEESLPTEKPFDMARGSDTMDWSPRPRRPCRDALASVGAELSAPPFEVPTIRDRRVPSGNRSQILSIAAVQPALARARAWFVGAIPA